MHSNTYWVYIMTNPAKTVLYVGVTNDLTRRIAEHKQKAIPGFTEKYNLTSLVYFEETNDIRNAIEREKEVKGWVRDKKNALVTDANPDWKDLAAGLL